MLACLVQRPIDEARPVRPEDPRDAHNQRPLVRLQRAPFPCPLRCAVNADRPRFVFFRVGRALLAVENIIRTDVNEPRLFLGADFREHTRRFAVNCERFLLVRFAPVHIRLRRRVDQRLELQPAQRRPHLLRRSKVELRVIESDDIESLRIFARQRRAQSPTRANNDDSLHRRLR